MVLITDGEDTCNADPCDVARGIASQGIHLVIDTLGLIPDAKTRDQLSCIAEATGGTYTTVQHKKNSPAGSSSSSTAATDPVVTPVAAKGATACTERARAKAGLYTDRRSSRRPLVPRRRRAGQGAARLGERRRRPRRQPGLRRAAARGHPARPGDRRGEAAGTGRTDVVSAGLRYPKAEADDDNAPRDRVPPGRQLLLRRPLGEDHARDCRWSSPSTWWTGPTRRADVASFGLGRGWWLLGAAGRHRRPGGSAVGLGVALAARVWRTN